MNHLLRMASVAGENFASHGEVSVVAYCLASCHFVGEVIVRELIRSQPLHKAVSLKEGPQEMVCELQRQRVSRSQFGTNILVIDLDRARWLYYYCYI